MTVLDAASARDVTALLTRILPVPSAAIRVMILAVPPATYWQRTGTAGHCAVAFSRAGRLPVTRGLPVRSLTPPLAAALDGYRKARAGAFILAPMALPNNQLADFGRMMVNVTASYTGTGSCCASRLGTMAGVWCTPVCSSSSALLVPIVWTTSESSSSRSSVSSSCVTVVPLAVPVPPATSS